ncbi:UDP-3-O-acylglucosamine N-acyltransferase [Striga asiatica]|uniref:UDP-3-O-acylglucosamine N-acyltransferase n=1 Tax=Striga asiatica TaxID=4170 RepID=A0A5A7PB12_STRAF|nr:UDP-3-O-acylglucosamine N-acyltransferase [Striga asiatica]
MAASPTLFTTPPLGRGAGAMSDGGEATDGDGEDAAGGGDGGESASAGVGEGVAGAGGGVAGDVRAGDGAPLGGDGAVDGDLTTGDGTGAMEGDWATAEPSSTAAATIRREKAFDETAIRREKGLERERGIFFWVELRWVRAQENRCEGLIYRGVGDILGSCGPLDGDLPREHIFWRGSNQRRGLKGKKR